MTIINGIVHPSGLSMAADGEEGTIVHKRSISKFYRIDNKHSGTMIIGGAGPSAQIEALSQGFEKIFKNATTENWQRIENRIASLSQDFYADHVQSWPTQEEREDNDFSLLIGVAIQNTKGEFTHLLKAVENGILRETVPYYAIGVAQDRAKALLDEYLALHPPLLTSILTAYVVFRLKEDTQNIGKQTEVWTIDNGKVAPILRPYLEELDSLFKRYEYAKVRHFLTIFDPNSFPGVQSLHDEHVVEEATKLRADLHVLLGKISSYLSC